MNSLVDDADVDVAKSRRRDAMSRYHGFPTIELPRTASPIPDVVTHSKSCDLRDDGCNGRCAAVDKVV